MSTQHFTVPPNDAGRLWRFLQRNGGIDERRYDAGLVSELRKALKLGNGAMRAELSAKRTSVESLVHAFFSLAAPFAGMSTDILAMFENAGARRSTKNVAIAFRFSDKTPPLKFELKHFREFAEAVEQVKVQLHQSVWPRDVLWRLHAPIVITSRLSSAVAQKWVDLARKTWPPAPPDLPVTGHDDFDALAAAVWPLVWTVIDQLRRFGRSPGRLGTEFYGRKITRSEIEPDSNGWSAETLASLDSDFFPSAIVRSYFSVAEELTSGIALSKDTQAWLDKVPQLLAEMQTRSSAGERAQYKLQELLRLPVWNRRYEVYSVWIAAKIMEAMGWSAITIHTVNEELRFDFRATNLATTRNLPEPIHLVAELRTPLAAPRGKNRRAGIQPDYRLIGVPFDDPGAHKLIVECKQYLRPSIRNFSDAITDYARGAPNAMVVLVNYGPADEHRILAAVPRELRARSVVIGSMRPDHDASLERFRRFIANIVAPSTPSNPMAESLRSASSSSLVIRIDLSWKAPPNDLDLHASIEAPGFPIEHVYHRVMTDERDLAHLLKDIRDGNGSEILEISAVDDRHYQLFVHDYTSSGNMAKSAPVVRITGPNIDPITIRMPIEDGSDFWSVCHLVPNTRAITVINQCWHTCPVSAISDDFPIV